jgi:UDP-3-O-[3-hydroxymyristoyl] glucosamine N-acyltransferase
MVAAKAGIHNDLDDDVVVGGIPAVHIRQWRRYSAVITRLPEVIRRMRALERQVGVESE